MYRVLTKSYPNVRCELDFKNPFQLLVATVLSAQCTDKRVNQTTPALFKKYKSIKKMAKADLADIEQLVKSTGFFRAKAKNIKLLSEKIMNDFDKATNRVGNRFDLVLIASERMREIHRKRREQEQLKLLTVEQRRKNVVPSVQAISDIENGIVGREYLGRVKSRSRQKRVKFDEI